MRGATYSAAMDMGSGDRVELSAGVDVGVGEELNGEESVTKSDVSTKVDEIDSNTSSELSSFVFVGLGVGVGVGAGVGVEVGAAKEERDVVEVEMRINSSVIG